MAVLSSGLSVVNAGLLMLGATSESKSRNPRSNQQNLTRSVGPCAIIIESRNMYSWVVFRQTFSICNMYLYNITNQHTHFLEKEKLQGSINLIRSPVHVMLSAILPLPRERYNVLCHVSCHAMCQKMNHEGRSDHPTRSV
jgi:hypothetical protein